jgi:hypothetical protein
MPFNKRCQILERFQSLSDLKKIKSLVQLDLQYSSDIFQSVHMFSVIELQNYM